MVTCRESVPAQDPLTLFEEWYARAVAEEGERAAAVSLATVDPAGKPSLRQVFFRGMVAGGFSFYTHYQSRKARDLAANPNAALAFYWPGCQAQIRVEGRVERLCETASDAYFASRERSSRIGAWVSRQSQPLDDREALLTQFSKMTQRFEGRPVPRPTWWGGFALQPRYLEFWRSGSHRLHHRLVYRRQRESWTTHLLQP